MENMAGITMRNQEIGAVAQKIKQSEEEGKDFAEYLAGSSDDSDLSDEDECGGSGMISVTAGGQTDANIPRNELIDGSLIDLLNLCKGFEAPDEAYLKEHAV